MPPSATGEVIERPRGDRRTFALRFRAYGRRHFVTLGNSDEGWTRQRAEAELRYVPDPQARATHDGQPDVGRSAGPRQAGPDRVRRRLSHLGDVARSSRVRVPRGAALGEVLCGS